MRKKQAVYTIFKAAKTYLLYDPVSLERIKKKFVLIRNNCSHYYDASTLYEYIIATGDFYDPITRYEYDSCELLRLDHINGMPSHNILEKKENLLIMRKNYFTMISLCDAFETEIVEQITKIRDNINYDNFGVQLKFEITPLIIQSFDNLRTVNKERCRLIIKYILDNLHKNPIKNLEIHLHICHLFEVLLDCCDR